MKSNRNRNQRSFAFAALLGLLAIATSMATTVLKPLSRGEAKLPEVEQQAQTEEEAKFELSDRDNKETWEEVKLDEEWDSILGNEPEEEILIAGSRAF